MEFDDHFLRSLPDFVYCKTAPVVEYMLRVSVAPRYVDDFPVGPTVSRWAR